MAQKISKWKKFKRFLKRNMTPTWAKHFSYQVFAFLTSVAMIVGVADYAVTKSYAERKLTLMDDFTITAHTGAFDTEMNTIDSVKAAIKNKAEVIELDIRQRPDKTVVMSHDLVVTNNDAAELAKKNNFDYFCTTLSISPLKNSQKINEIGFELEKELDVKWLPSDFKKKEGYKRSIVLSKEYNLYRQNFCGCAYSKAQSVENK